MSNIKDHIKQAKLPERSVRICLDQTLTADIEELQRKLAELNRGPDTSTLESNPRRNLQLQMEELRAQMLEHSDEFRLRAMPRREFTAMLKAHPPRDDDRIDALNGTNMDTFTDAMIRRCVVAPEMDEGDWAALFGDGTDDNPGILSSGQYDQLADTAWKVNRRDVDVPFLPGGSQTRMTSVSE